MAVEKPMEYWNTGKMENWGLKADDGLILFSGSCRLYEKDPIPSNPLFQRSNIPSLHVIGLQHSQSPLTWPNNKVCNIGIY